MGKQCSHLMCGDVCRRPAPPPKKRTALKRSPIKQKSFAEKIALKNKMAKTAYKNRKAKKAIRKEVTDPYFEFWMLNASGKCENCGEPIPVEHFRMTQAHILPKRLDYGFPSVAGELDNHLELCVEHGCHTQYDRSWDDAKRMPCFGLARGRFKLFAHKIAPEERHRIPECFG